MTKETQKRSQVLKTALDGKEGGRLRAALYARVSTEEQAKEGYSIDGQIDRLKAHAKAKGFEIANLYVDDGFSARTEKRPEYERMFSEIREWDILAVLKMDRIHRNMRNFMRMIDLLRRREKDFDSVMDNFDTSTATGRLVMNLIQEIAQWESEIIGERTSDGLGYAFELKGKRAMGHQAPYGYRWSEGHPKHGTGHLVLLEQQATEVIIIFQMAEAGMGRGKISEELGWCSCKVRTIKQRKTLGNGKSKVFSYQGKKANCGGCERVAYILNNPFYVGYQLYQGKILPGEHVAIIGRELFENVQARRPKMMVVLPEA